MSQHKTVETVVNGVKVLVWCDNEWGYMNHMVDLAAKVAESL